VRISDEDRAACRAAIEGLRNEGIFTPPSLQGTLVMPSNIGGAHWGGVEVDPEREIAIVPVNRIAASVQLIPREGFDFQKTRSEEQRLGEDYECNFIRGTPCTCGGECCWHLPSCRVRRRPSAPCRDQPEDGRPSLGGAARIADRADGPQFRWKGSPGRSRDVPEPVRLHHDLARAMHSDPA
jgi:hypothetical protein